MIMILSFITGIIVGVVFSLLRMPIPAPNNIEGVLGIVGIFVGMLIINILKKYA